LNIILEEMLQNPNKTPKRESLDQLEYDLTMLTELLEKTDDQNDAAILQI
jgi:hypothetical protein